MITDDLVSYIDQKCIPGGTQRNWDSYGNKIATVTAYQKAILADPQTSGGLLIAVDANSTEEVKGILQKYGLEKCTTAIGSMVTQQQKLVMVNT